MHHQMQKEPWEDFRYLWRRSLEGTQTRGSVAKSEKSAKLGQTLNRLKAKTGGNLSCRETGGDSSGCWGPSPSLFSLPWSCLGEKARSSVQSHQVTISFGFHRPLPVFFITDVFPITLAEPTTLHLFPGAAVSDMFSSPARNQTLLTHSIMLEWEKRIAPLSKIDANASSDLKTAPSLGN